MSDKTVEPYLNASKRETKHNSDEGETSPSFDQWHEKFGPLLLNPAGEELFETSGEDFALVRCFDVNRVWTIVDVDDRRFIIPGIHYVNRLNYYVTTRPREKGDEDIWYEIPLDEEDETTQEPNL